MTTFDRTALDRLSTLELLDWQTLDEGHLRGLVPGDEVVRYAVARLEESSEADGEAVLLAGADGDEDSEVASLLRSLADREGRRAPSPAVERWLLAKLLAAREEAPGEEALMRAVADIYAELDYPPELAPAVYYMPVPGSDTARVGDVLSDDLSAFRSGGGTIPDGGSEGWFPGRHDQARRSEREVLGRRYSRGNRRLHLLPVRRDMSMDIEQATRRILALRRARSPSESEWREASDTFASAVSRAGAEQLQRALELVIDELLLPPDLKDGVYERLLELNGRDPETLREYAWHMQIYGPGRDDEAEVLIAEAERAERDRG